MSTEIDFQETFAAFSPLEQRIIKNKVRKADQRRRWAAMNAVDTAPDRYEPVAMYEDYLLQIADGVVPSLAGFLAHIADPTDEIRVPTTKALVITKYAPTVTAA